MSDRVPPHDHVAEESLLGAMLLSRPAIAEIGELGPDDFHRPAHGLIFQAILALHESGQGVDPVTVASFLDAAGLLARVGGRPELARIQAETPASANAGAYARTVQERAVARRAIGKGHEIAEAGWAMDLDKIRELAEDAAAGFSAPLGRTRAIELDDLLAQEDLDEAKPWVLPGWLRLRERVILTGEEGWGKSTFMRQCAICYASGIHPGHGLRAGMVEPGSALVIDLQEDRFDLGQAFQALRRQVGDAYVTGNLHAISRDQGMNLLSGVDRRWLESLIADVRPQLVCIGPARKMIRTIGARLTSEEAIDELTRVLDDLRIGYGFTLMLEAHAGLDRDDSNYRIRGSSVWKDWPEFGLGFKPVDPGPPRIVEVVDWRGRRHVGRPWPRTLHGGQGLPWTPDAESYEALCRYIGEDWLVPELQTDLGLLDQPLPEELAARAGEVDIDGPSHERFTRGS